MNRARLLSLMFSNVCHNKAVTAYGETRLPCHIFQFTKPIVSGPTTDRI
jgi:hypothetical protein